MLVEYDNEEQVSCLLNTATYGEDTAHMVPVKSPLLWFKVENKTNVGKFINPESVSEFKLLTKNGCDIPSEKTVMNILSKSNNVSEQIQTLYDLTHLNDIGIRLRYIAAKQVKLELKFDKKNFSDQVLFYDLYFNSIQYFR